MKTDYEIKKYLEVLREFKADVHVSLVSVLEWILDEKRK